MSRFAILWSLRFVITEVKQRKPRKESSSRSPKKKGKGKNPWETDSEVEDEELSSDEDGVSQPPPRTTSRRTAGGTVTINVKLVVFFHHRLLLHKFGIALDFCFCVICLLLAPVESGFPFNVYITPLAPLFYHVVVHRTLSRHTYRRKVMFNKLSDVVILFLNIQGNWTPVTFC
jgi:hypothetical protein